ncbi:MAG TPA: hypothetical protein VEW48_03600 [Thermoanaerobaculia bacterium]|nr:hypothetical protein [Thermoanaerobaculia bacterium]
MSRTPAENIAPTLLIPQGTRIEVDAEGHLSISAPGNLIVQNSGKYGTLESVGGSIRIDRGVEVEAVTVRCADTCYVQGFLTAWKVSARCLNLDDSARAHVVLQETQRLEIGRDARLVGNFSSEREMLGLFARFAQQVRSLPFFEKRSAPAAGLLAKLDETIDLLPTPKPAADLPEPLLFAMVLLEREAEHHHPPSSRRAIEELVKLLREQDLETLRHTWRLLFTRIAEPREHARRARELVEEHYGGAGA